ncbi:MAG: response regulator transcription factor [Lachnospiraceae bacterium]|nr:response regulator transcription factor [Lachnospiraceae bacterium]
MAFNVLIVDDQNISRSLFESYVQSDPGYRLIKALDSARVADAYVLSTRIDLVIMDVVMSDGSNGLDAAEKIKKAKPDCKVIIVTSMPEVSYLARAREIGVDSFWYKETRQISFVDVLNRTMAGEHVYPSSTPLVRLGNCVSTELTDRELEILRYLTTGVSNQEIADMMNISVHTVKVHVAHLLEKTGFANRTRLAIEARITGLVISE